MNGECNACCSTILDGLFMQCSNDTCMKRYDLKCLNIMPGAYKAYTQAYKNKWVCPDCICLRPKCGNIETPLRNDLTDLTIITTPQNNVNTQRGSQTQFSPIVMDNDVDSALLVELRQFRSDIIGRLDSQANAITQLQYQFSQTKSYLDNLVKIISVIETKVNQTQHSKQVAEEKATTSSPTTFAEALSQKNRPNTKSKKIASKQQTVKKQLVNTSAATKSTVPPAQKIVTIASVPSILLEQEEGEEPIQAEWTTVRNKKSNRLSKNVGIGKNTELKSVQAIERKKHLHVWRLHPETTEEAITDHVKSICGQDLSLKVQKIKHKTERDYASFIIGVPEKNYEYLNRAEIWPVNAEFNEWIWFRTYSKTTANEQQQC